MKIGEALLERDYLDRYLDVIESRLRDDLLKGRPPTHLLAELDQTFSRALALQDAIDWTMQHLAVNKLPLGSYLNKVAHLKRVSTFLEKTSSPSPEFRERIDKLHDARKATEVVIQNIYWAYDLQIPEIDPDDKPEEEN